MVCSAICSPFVSVCLSVCLSGSLPASHVTRHVSKTSTPKTTPPTSFLGRDTVKNEQGKQEELPTMLLCQSQVDSQTPEWHPPNFSFVTITRTWQTKPLRSWVRTPNNYPCCVSVCFALGLFIYPSVFPTFACLSHPFPPLLST